MTAETIAGKMCCGCGLCEIVCPQKCIAMEFDDEGFRHARIDMKRCIKCNKCIKSCIAINPEHKVKPVKAYGAWHTDKTVRQKSSSGGMFTAIAEEAFIRELPVYAVEETENGLGFRKAVCMKDIGQMHGSRYYQAFYEQRILEDMKTQKGGVVVGLPCQIAFAKRYLQGRWDYYFVDLICHGVCSKWLVDVHRKEVEKRHGKKLVRHSFRCKRDGKKGSQVSCYEFTDEKKYCENEDDIYMRFFSPCFSLMEACYGCRYAGEERLGDITIGDFNGASEILPQLPEDGCVSALLVNTQKGERLIKNSHIVRHEVPVEAIKKQNIPLVHSSKRPWFRGMVYPSVRLFGLKGSSYLFGAKYYCKKVMRCILGEAAFDKLKKALGRMIITQ